MTIMARMASAVGTSLRLGGILRGRIAMNRLSMALLVYFFAYLALLFRHPEREGMHWLTLVIIPLLGLRLLEKDSSIPQVLASIGLNTEAARRGWAWALPFMVVFQGLQFLNRGNRAALLLLLERPAGWLLLPAAVILLLGTAATTEEVFFRGILQTRLGAAFRNEAAGAAVATLLFVGYHVPYTYLNKAWPSAGHLGPAVQAACVNGLVGGLPIALVFWRSRQNLLAAIFMHVAIDLIPATLLLSRMLGQ